MPLLKRLPLLLLAAVLFCGLVIVPATATAILRPEGTPEQTDPSQPQILNTTDAVPRAARLDEAKRRICEKREERIQTLIRGSVARAQRHVDVFTTISNRVQAFYKDKGEAFAAYGQLVSAVSTQKRTVDASLKTLQESAAFACNSDAPKAQLANFREAHQQVLRDLKAYRQAVRDLIVGVKTALEASRKGADE